MAWQKPQHLAQVVEANGTGSATATIVRWVEEGIKAANDASQAERIAAKGTDKKANPYATDAGKCVRQVYFSLTGVPQTEPLTTDSYINFGVGHSVEEWLAGCLKASGAEVMQEVRIEIPAGDTVVSGRVDFLLGLKEENALVELKTTSSRAMGAMLRYGELGKDDHRKQANIYLHASQLGLLPHKYDHAYLVYCVKDATRREPPLHAFQVNYDKSAAEADLKSLALIAKMAAAGRDPGIPAEYQAKFAEKGKTPVFPCGYCSYKTHCWKER